jgi:mannose/fructose/N-acetylgalactosamine-specific phosphotransferase system component IIC
MTRETRRERMKGELEYVLATLALPVAVVGFPVALLLGAVFGEKVHRQDQSFMPFVIKCGLGTVGLAILVVGIAMLVSTSPG